MYLFWYIMGYNWDFGAEITGYIMNFLVQFFSSIVSAFLRLFGRQPKNPYKNAEQATHAAKNPPVNMKLASPEPHGIFFGTHHNQYVVKPEETDGHVLVVGGTGSGKSSCVAIPTLRNWLGTIFAVDIKGELYTNTRQHRRNIKLFDPENKNNRYIYDPYVFLNQSTNPAQEARAIAQAVIPLPHDVKEPFWIESAQIILTGAILHYHHAKCSFIETLRNIQSQNPQALIKIISDSSNDKAALCAKSFDGMDSKVLAGIFAEISRGIIALVTDDDIVAALSHENNKEIISPRDLENGSDVYIRIPEYLLRQWKNLLTLMVNQFISFFERRKESPDNRPILFLLDEFPRLGKIPAITDALATLRSKKITICIIIQSLAQLKMIYGHDAQEVIADTCAYKAVLGATDANTQEYFSKLVGTYEKIRSSHSQNYDPYIGAPTGHSTQTSQDYEKRIIKPEEFATLQNQLILLYPLPHNFCRVHKQPYYLR
jgi:type IV secretion system protein VirD4